MGREHVTRLTGEDLERLRDRLAQQLTPSPGGDLQAMIDDIVAALGRSPLLSGVTARKTGGHEYHLQAACRPASEGLDPWLVMEEVARIWAEELRYDDFEAHAVTIEDGIGLLEFLTGTSDPPLYLSGLIVVELEPES